MVPTKDQVIETIYRAIRTDAVRTPLALWNEFHTKVVAGTALLESGLKIIEGMPRKASGDRLSFTEGRLERTIVTLPKYHIRDGKSASSPDLRIDAPSLHVLIKTKPDFGSKAQRQAEAIVKDLKHLTKRHADVFFLVSELEPYRRLRYEDGKKHGNAGHVKECQAWLPASEKFKDSLDITWRTASCFRWAGGRFWTNFGTERLIVVMRPR